jgi:hypothetical protein
MASGPGASSAPARLKPSKRAAQVDGSSQLTLFGLARVVVLEDCMELRQTLKSADSSDAERVGALRKLDSLAITEKTLRKTRVGKTVNSLTTHRSGKVRQAAKKLVHKWKSLVLEAPKHRVRPPPPRPVSEEERVRKSCLGTLTARLSHGSAGQECAAPGASADTPGAAATGAAAPPPPGVPRTTISTAAAAGEIAIWTAAGGCIGPNHARVLRAVVQRFEDDAALAPSLLEGRTSFDALLRHTDYD